MKNSFSLAFVLLAFIWVTCREIDDIIPNHPPVANAGADVAATTGGMVALDGSQSFDPDDDILSYTWEWVSRPAQSFTSINSFDSVRASFTPDQPGLYRLRLLVTDNIDTSVDTIQIVTTTLFSVNTINPTSGSYGITVKIAGSNFSSVAANNTVRFNGMEAVVSSASINNIDAIVPKGAGTGPVSVTINGVTVNGPVFTYQLSPTVSTATQFNAPIYATTDVNGNVYISDYNNHVIRRLTPMGQLSIIAGNGQAGYANSTNPLTAQFNHPAGIAIDGGNNLYVADYDNHCIRRIALSTGVVTTLAGFPQAGFNDAQGGQAQFNGPIGLGIDNQGNLYVGDFNNYRLRRVTPAGVVSTFAGNGQAGFNDATGALAQFRGLTGVTVDAANNVYVADAVNHRIRKVTPQAVVTTLAGNEASGFVNGTGTVARFNMPYGVGCDASGNVYVADFLNHSIRRITPQGSVTTLAGNGASGYVEGKGTSAQFNQPTSVVVHSNGNICVSDFGNQRLRLIVFE